MDVVLMSDNCIFCKIIAGEIPAQKVHENELFLAILDRFPANMGHVIIIPKRHAENIFELNENEATALMPLALQVAKKIKTELKPDGLNMLQNNGTVAGQTVFHYHLHLIPRFNNDGFSFKHPHNDVEISELDKMHKRLAYETV